MRNQVKSPVQFSYQDRQISFSTEEKVVMINATEMIKAFPKKRVNDFIILKQTKEFIKVLESKTGIPVLDVSHGGANPGTWMHELLAMEFARWLSPEFAIWTNKCIRKLLTDGVVTLGALAENQVRYKTEAGERLYTMAEIKEKKYYKMPALSRAPEGVKWEHEQISGFEPRQVVVAVFPDGSRWYCLSHYLIAKGYYKHGGDVVAFAAELPQHQTRKLNPLGKGVGRIFVHKDALSNWEIPLYETEEVPAPMRDHQREPKQSDLAIRLMDLLIRTSAESDRRLVYEAVQTIQNCQS